MTFRVISILKLRWALFGVGENMLLCSVLKWCPHPQRHINFTGLPVTDEGMVETKLLFPCWPGSVQCILSWLVLLFCAEWETGIWENMRSCFCLCFCMLSENILECPVHGIYCTCLWPEVYIYSFCTHLPVERKGCKSWLCCVGFPYDFLVIFSQHSVLIFCFAEMDSVRALFPNPGVQRWQHPAPPKESNVNKIIG